MSPARQSTSTAGVRPWCDDPRALPARADHSLRKQSPATLLPASESKQANSPEARYGKRISNLLIMRSQEFRLSLLPKAICRDHYAQLYGFGPRGSPTPLDANPQALPRTQSSPQHSGDRDHSRAPCNTVGAGLGSAAFRLLVALPAACSAGCGLCRTTVYDPTRLRSWLLFPPSYGK
jgi:hypothetical protein